MKNKRVKLYIGGPVTGKTRKALEEIAGKEYVLFEGRDFDHFNQYTYASCDENTECIIIDDYPVSKLKELLFFADLESFLVVRKYQPSFMIDTPDIIITCCTTEPLDASFYDVFEVVKFDKVHESPTNK
jgi:hypothetical protein